MSNLPDTFAGGTFNLPLKVAKLVRLADSTHSEHERESIVRKLWGMGYFLDKVGVIWDKNNVGTAARKHDPMYASLAKAVKASNQIQD